MSDYAEQDRWTDFLDAERDEENEHRHTAELERQERLYDRGLPHAFKCKNPEDAWIEDTKRTLALADGTPRKPARFSQCEKIMRVLEDGEWHTTSEILRAVPSIVHSRIAELRKRGYIIEHERTGSGAQGSRYRLVERRAA